MSRIFRACPTYSRKWARQSILPRLSSTPLSFESHSSIKSLNVYVWTCLWELNTHTAIKIITNHKYRDRGMINGWTQ